MLEGQGYGGTRQQKSRTAHFGAPAKPTSDSVDFPPYKDFIQKSHFPSAELRRNSDLHMDSIPDKGIEAT